MEEVTVGGATAFMYKALVAIKDLEETILVLLLWEGIPSKSTTASLGLVRKTIGNRVCTLLVMAAVGTEAVGIHARSIKNKAQQKDRLY